VRASIENMITQQTNTSAGAHNPILRVFNIKPLFLNISMELLKLVKEVVDKIEEVNG
jgi:hypothetical protein